MKRNRCVKIVATLGPSSSSYDQIKALFEAGADVFRLNMSHGTHAETRERHQIIRDVERDVGRPISILADLQGPKLRCATFKNEFEMLEIGDKFRFDLTDSEGDKTRVHLPHPEILEALTPGARLLVNDGTIRMRVEECGPDFANCVVEVGGKISDRKGVNVPDVVLPLAALTDKDREDLEFVCALGVDWLGLSFVQRRADIEEAQALVKGRAAIITKVEKPAAVADFNEILDASDGIMVARGDLGVEMPIEEVPPMQKMMIRRCRAAGKPVIVATQMLESMVKAPVPTRAEVSDVATAIYEGADAVMLSAESAAGAYPVEAVQTMDRVAIGVENDPNYPDIMAASRKAERATVAEAMVAAAREIAETTEIKAIACFTHSGKTAALAARERPVVPIIALTPLMGTARKMCLYWGLHCVTTGEVGRFKLAVVSAARAARSHDFATKSDKIAVMAGIPFNTPGSTNILRVAPVDETQFYEGDSD